MIRPIANIIAGSFDRRRATVAVRRHCNPAIPRARRAGAYFARESEIAQNKRSNYPGGGFWATNWQLVCAG